MLAPTNRHFEPHEILAAIKCNPNSQASTSLTSLGSDQQEGNSSLPHEFGHLLGANAFRVKHDTFLASFFCPLLRQLGSAELRRFLGQRRRRRRRRPGRAFHPLQNCKNNVTRRSRGGFECLHIATSVETRNLVWWQETSFSQLGFSHDRQIIIPFKRN